MARKTVFLLPALGAGHLTPMLEAAKRLLHHLNISSDDSGGIFSVTVLLLQSRPPDITAAVNARIAESGTANADLDIDIDICRLPHVAAGDVDGLEDLVSRHFQLSVPHVREAIAGSPVPVAAIIVDFFATAVLDVAAELAVPAYVFFTSTAALLALMLHLPSLQTKEFDEMDVPGMSLPVPPGSLPAAMASKKSRGYGWYIYHGKRFLEAKGIVVNTTADVEPEILAAISDGLYAPGRVIPPVYPIGPVIPAAEMSPEPHECISWLDKQPPASVLFLCFGSLGCFDVPQVHEIALGLERSGSRFLWALRNPPAAGKVHPTDANLAEVLPGEFLHRTSERGFIWPLWAPQRAILSHAAVGGFVTHCGAASCLESLWSGVPVIAWPLYSEQYFHAHTMENVVGTAVGVLKPDEENGGLVAAAELEHAVRSLMEEGSDVGRRARARAAELKTACRNAVGDGGSSHAALSRLADDIRRGGT